LARQRAALYATYRFADALADALVGVLLRGFGTQDLVLVVSDHGFENARPGDPSSGVHVTEQAIDGIVFAAGPGVPSGGQVRNMSVTDIAPTLLAWLGLAVGSDMSGRVADFLPIETGRIRSWDDLPVEHVGGKESGAEDVIVEQLRALGYLE
jgi:arylsulfatase A-like enzyme